MIRQLASHSWLKYGALPLLVLVVVVLLRFVCFVVVRIDSNQMSPSIQSGAYIIASRFSSPRVGDIVLFRAKPKTSTLSIARVVAQPGDSLSYTSGQLICVGKSLRTDSPPTCPDYAIRLPRAEETLALSPLALVAYRDAIEREVGDFADQPSIRWEGGRLYIAGVEVGHFEFRRDYYWLLTDEADQAPDSRHLGIIPHDAIEAVVLFHY